MFYDTVRDRAYLPAELFAVQRQGRKRNLFYHRFDTAALAIKFAVEDMPQGTSNLSLEIEFSRLEDAGIVSLYDADEFPLERRSSGRLAS